MNDELKLALGGLLLALAALVRVITAKLISRRAAKMADRASRTKETQAHASLLASQAEMLEQLTKSLQAVEARIASRDRQLELLRGELEREKDLRNRQHRELIEQGEATLAALGDAQDKIRELTSEVELLRVERDELKSEVDALTQQLRNAGIVPAPKPVRTRNEKGQYTK